MSGRTKSPLHVQAVEKSNLLIYWFQKYGIAYPTRQMIKIYPKRRLFNNKKDLFLNGVRLQDFVLRWDKKWVLSGPTSSCRTESEAFLDSLLRDDFKPTIIETNFIKLGEFYGHISKEYESFGNMNHSYQL